MKYCTLFLLFFVFSAQIFACSCRPPLAMTDIEFFNADLVFIGKITYVNADEETYKRTATFEIINPLKVVGDMKTIDIVTPYQSATCGLTFLEGQLWYIWASNDGTMYSSNICTRSLRLEEDGTSAVPRYQEDMLAIAQFKQQNGKQNFDTNTGTGTGKIRNGFKEGCWKYYNQDGVLEKKCKFRKGVEKKCKTIE